MDIWVADVLKRIEMVAPSSVILQNVGHHKGIFVRVVDEFKISVKKKNIYLYKDFFYNCKLIKMRV